jgi:hypothetical protein
MPPPEWPPPAEGLLRPSCGSAPRRWRPSPARQGPVFELPLIAATDAPIASARAASSSACVWPVPREEFSSCRLSRAEPMVVLIPATMLLPAAPRAAKRCSTSTSCRPSSATVADKASRWRATAASVCSSRALWSRRSPPMHLSRAAERRGSRACVLPASRSCQCLRGVALQARGDG